MIRPSVSQMSLFLLLKMRNISRLVCTFDTFQLVSGASSFFQSWTMQTTILISTYFLLQWQVSLASLMGKIFSLTRGNIKGNCVCFGRCSMEHLSQSLCLFLIPKVPSRSNFLQRNFTCKIHLANGRITLVSLLNRRDQIRLFCLLFISLSFCGACCVLSMVLTTQNMINQDLSGLAVVSLLSLVLQSLLC